MHIPDDLSGSVKDRARRKIERLLGAEYLTIWQDPRVVEMMLNDDGKLWVERLGEEMECIGVLQYARGQALIETVAGYHGKVITFEEPTLEAEFPLDGSRFAGQLPPSVLGPTFAIRKHAVSVYTLDQYVKSGVMSRQQMHAILEAVDAHRNILVVGGTGSGKTTLVNAIIHQMVETSPRERVCIIEDTGEIQCSATNRIRYYTTLTRSMTDYLRTALRMRPDRILVGEVRGPEALDLLDAWNTGHEGGAATLHANNARAGLDRLRSLVTRNNSAPPEIEPLIGEVVHVIVHIARTKGGRRVEELLEVNGYKNGKYLTRQL